MSIPLLNSCLNGTSAVFLLLGFYFIRQRNIRAHMASMITALIASAAFLVSYLIYHFTHPMTRFPELGWIKTAYLALLATHVLLAIINLPMIILTVVPAVQRKFDRHKRLARWTLPIWLYVSVTGVIVYLMVYQWFPPGTVRQP